jgi:ABC-type transport system substrate-binding protein
MHLDRRRKVVRRAEANADDVMFHPGTAIFVDDNVNAPTTHAWTWMYRQSSLKAKVDDYTVKFTFPVQAV